MPRKLEPVISPRVVAVYDKLKEDPTGASLTRKERQLEVSKTEAAHLFSVLAGRRIKEDYMRQLTRGDNPRLTPARAIGNTYLFTVESLLGVRFSKPHSQDEQPEHAA